MDLAVSFRFSPTPKGLIVLSFPQLNLENKRKGPGEICPGLLFSSACKNVIRLRLA